jgi:nucleoside-diphosphate-sugar epimerase
MKVVVTGAAGRLAAAVLPRLAADPSVSRIVAVDLRPLAATGPKFRSLQADFRSEAARELLAGADALVHLAFVVLRGRMARARMRDINVAGTLSLFAAARAAGVRRLVHLSSAGVYGSGEDLTEQAPLAPLPGFGYAEDKAAVERALAADFPDAVRLRPHLIAGPNAQPLLKRLLAQPFYVRAPAPEPRMQCVHEDDVAEAVALAVLGSGAGAYNLAADDTFSLGEAARRRHHRTLALPLPAARALVTLGWALAGAFGEPAWVAGAVRPITLDCGRALRELGWRPRYSGRAALAAMVPERA